LSITAVAIDAAQADRSSGVHGCGIGLAVARNATGAAAIGLVLCFAEARLPGLLAEQQSAKKRTNAAHAESNRNATSGHQASCRFIPLFSARLWRLASLDLGSQGWFSVSTFILSVCDWCFEHAAE
jgi:hypothetical protein